MQLIADALSRKNKRKNFKPRNIADINVDEDENVIVNHQETGASPTPIDLSRYELHSRIKNYLFLQNYEEFDMIDC